MRLGLVIFVCVQLVLISSCSRGVIKRNSRGRSRYHKTGPKKGEFGGIRKKIVLLKFFNEAPYGGEDLGITVTEELRKELSRTGEFIVDTRGSKIFGSSKEIYAGGGVKLVQLSRRAKIEGINFVIFGRVVDARIRESTDEIGLVRQTKSYTESKVEFRVFDVNSNKEIFTDVTKGYADDKSFRFFQSNRESKLVYRRNLLRYGVKVAVRKVIPRIHDISSKLDWVGRVAKIVGNKIYINAGRNSGIRVGDILKVITEGSEIFDPETGALIGVSKGEIKGTIEVIDYLGSDGSIAILHSGGSVLEGDFVQLY